MAESRLDVFPEQYAVLPSTVFEAAKATDVPLVLRGYTAQTGNLLEIRNSIGTVLTRVGPDGNFYNAAGNVLGTIVSPTTLTSTGAAQIPMSLVGMAGQTGDLQQWRNNTGTITTSIKADGTLAGTARDDMDAMYWMGVGV